MDYVANKKKLTKSEDLKGHFMLLYSHFYTPIQPLLSYNTAAIVL